MLSSVLVQYIKSSCLSHTHVYWCSETTAKVIVKISTLVYSASTHCNDTHLHVFIHSIPFASVVADIHVHVQVQ